MATTMSDPNEFERNQPHNVFSDRRAGGNAKNRAFFESNRTKPAQARKTPRGPQNPSEFKFPPMRGK